MRRWSRGFLGLMLALFALDLWHFVRDRELHDLLAAIGFAMMAWGFWRNPRGFRDAHGQDLTDDPGAARVSMAGAFLVVAAMALQLVMAFQR